jgi:hypothetical protein
MKVLVLAFALVCTCLPYLGQAQNVTEPDVLQMIAALKAAVPECAVNTRNLGNLLTLC